MLQGDACNLPAELGPVDAGNWALVAARPISAAHSSIKPACQLEGHVLPASGPLAGLPSVNAMPRPRLSPASHRAATPRNASLYSCIPSPHIPDLPPLPHPARAVLAANLLCRLPDPSIFLRRLPSLIKPGGVLVLVSPYSWLPAWTDQQHWLGGYRDEVRPLGAAGRVFRQGVHCSLGLASRAGG